MRVELRGTIRAAFGTGTIEVAVPPEGLPLDEVLARLSETNPRAGKLLTADGSRYVPRVVVNGTVVEREQDLWIREGDSLLLLTAMQGG